MAGMEKFDNSNIIHRSFPDSDFRFVARFIFDTKPLPMDHCFKFLNLCPSVRIVVIDSASTDCSRSFDICAGTAHVSNLFKPCFRNLRLHL